MSLLASDSDQRTALPTATTPPTAPPAATTPVRGAAPRMAPRRQRTISRAVHLAVGLVLGAFVYAPAAVAEPLHLFLQVAGVPAVVVSGLFLWKQAQIRRVLGRRVLDRGGLDRR